MAEESYAQEQAVVTCDSCNLLQVTWASFQRHDVGCFMCGGMVGTSPGNPDWERELHAPPEWTL